MKMITHDASTFIKYFLWIRYMNCSLYINLFKSYNWIR